MATIADPSLDPLRDVAQQAAAEVVRDIVDDVVEGVFPGDSPLKAPLKKTLRKLLIKASADLIEAIIEAVLDVDRLKSGTDRIVAKAREILDRNPRRMLHRADVLEDLGKAEKAAELRREAQALIEARMGNAGSRG